MYNYSPGSEGVSRLVVVVVVLVVVYEGEGEPGFTCGLSSSGSVDVP